MRSVPGPVGRLLVVGDVVTDIVARHRTPLAPGTDTAAAIRAVPGGAGANVACWAAHWGCPDVRLLGRVGADSAAWHEAALTRAGVRPRLVVDPEEPTGTVICLVDGGAGAERTFLTDSGASSRLSPDDWAPELLDGVAWLHLSGYLFFAESSRAVAGAAMAEARARGVPVSVDPASVGFLGEFGVERFLAAVEGVAVLLPSRGEAELLAGVGAAGVAGAVPDPGADSGADCGADSVAESAVALSRRFSEVVVTAGVDGAVVARGGEVVGRAPSVGVCARDTTGAGDAFTGAFVASRILGVGVVGAVREGCRAGAVAVGRVGGRPPVPLP
ncbi:sugar kinase [Streptomyces sp. G44]|uniref:carbohydrate kinase family protein n=1 Tax=Streptomyces sp. G44 TaxID=2807632 RepID=UPI0019608861|nr:PfkB family carbohydrate kinase [Streptomyces sp. G44]MBM7171300.1 sugar kinase [Streptomyces sp. G44]